jgi:hypothetical protein
VKSQCLRYPHCSLHQHSSQPLSTRPEVTNISNGYHSKCVWREWIDWRVLQYLFLWPQYQWTTSASPFNIHGIIISINKPKLNTLINSIGIFHHPIY